MPNLPRVVLLLETSIEYGRAILRGVARYERLHGPWSVYVEPGHFQHILPTINTSVPVGMIARMTSPTEVRVLKRVGCPVIVLEPSSDVPALSAARHGFHSIVTDSPAIARLAAQHLLGLGLTRFGFCGYAECPWSETRRTAFIAHLKAQGFSCSVFTEPVDVGGQGVLSQKRLKAWLLSLPKPAGVMACNDACGRQVVAACSEAGIAVPDQIAVIGVDNDELLCELADPPLSSVVLDCEQAGYAAAELLDGLMKGNIANAPQMISVRALTVMERRSTQPILVQDALVAAALRFIRDNVTRLISVRDVTDHVGVSRRTLERRFDHVFGHGIYDEITDCRLVRAKRLLLETDLPSYRVAEAAGFSNIQPMLRLFHRQEGCSPLAYRAKARKSKPDFG
jgi:LacI family transcriptional regulator